MQKKTKKEMTIDDLALMVAGGFAEVREDLNKFKKEMYSFQNKTESFQEEMRSFQEETKDSLVKIRGDISSLGDKYVSRFEFDKLLVRFINLEQKLKKK